jgi:hypothetical protein
MPTAIPEDSLREQVQKALEDLLRTDSHLAFTLLQTTRIDSGHSEVALNKARIALETVRRLVMRIDDPEVRHDILAGADELENLCRRAPAKDEAMDRNRQ